MPILNLISKYGTRGDSLSPRSFILLVTLLCALGGGLLGAATATSEKEAPEQPVVVSERSDGEDLESHTSAAGATPDLRQMHYRWRNDDGDETASGQPSEASATANTTTASTSDVDLDSMVLTPGAGDYLVWWSGSMEADTAADSQQYVSLYKNTTKDTTSQRTTPTASSVFDSPRPVSTQTRMTGVGASDPIKARWHTTANDALAHERTLTALPADASTTFQVAASSTVTTSSNSYVLLDSMTVTPGAGDYLAWFSGTMSDPDLNDMNYFSIYVNGALIAESERRIFVDGSITDLEIPVSTHARLVGVGASDTVEVRWRAGSGTGSVDFHDRSLTLLKIAASETTQASATAETTTTSSTDVLVSGMEMTPGAGDYIVWFSSSFEAAAADTYQHLSLYADGVKIPASARVFRTEGSIPATAANAVTHAYITGLGAGQKIEARWRTTGSTAKMYERSLIAMKISGTGTGATHAEDEDTKLENVPRNSTRRVRLLVSNEGTGASTSVTYQLQVAQTNTCSSGTYTAVPTTGTGHWQIVGSTYYTDGSPTTNIVPGLTDEATTFVAGEIKDTGNTTSGITLAADAFTEIEYAVQATANAVPGGDYCFRLYDTTAGSPLNFYTQYAEASLPTADLKITLADSPDPVPVNGPLTYTLTGENLGPGPAANVVITNTLPGAVTYVSASGVGWSCSHLTGTVTCSRATLDANTTAPPVNISVVAPATAQTLTNNVSISSNDPDPVGGNNTASENTTVIVPSPDLRQVHYRWRNDDGDQTVSGQPTEVSATADTTTTSTSDVDLDSMSITPGAGDYLVWWSGSVEAGNAVTGDQHVSLYENATKVAASERGSPTVNNVFDSPRPVATQTRLTGFGPSDTVKARWSTSVGEGLVRERTLTTFPADAADTFQVSSTTTTNNSTTSSYSALDSMTITPGAGDYLAWFSGTLRDDEFNDPNYISIYRNGVKVPESEREVWIDGDLNGREIPVATHARLVGVGASEAIEVRWRSGEGDVDMEERTLTLLKVASSETYEASATASTSTTSSADVKINGMEVTPGAGDYLVWFSGSVEADAGDTFQHLSLYADGVKVTESARVFRTEGSLPGTAAAAVTHAFITGVGAGKKIEARWRTTGSTARMHERSLIVMRVSGTGSGASYAEDEDTKLENVPRSSTRRVRFEVSNEGTGASPSMTYQLQVAETGTCSSGSYTAVPTDGSGHWQIVGSTHFIDGAPTTNIVPGLTDEGSTFVTGQMKDTSNTTSGITLAADAFTELEYAVQATANASAGGDYCFRLWDTTAGSALDAYTKYAEASLPTADLGITITDDDPVVTNSNFTYTLTAENLGPGLAANVVITNTLPGAVTYVSAAGSGWSCSHLGGVVTCSRTSLDAETTAPPVTITVTAPATAQTLINDASIVSDDPDPVPTNDNDSETTTVNVPAPDLDQIHTLWRNDDGDETAGGGSTPTEVTATSSDTTGSSTYNDLVSMSTTPGAGDYLVWFSTSVESSSSSDQEFSLFRDTTAVSHTKSLHTTDSSTPDTPRPIALQDRVMGVGASEALNVQWKTSGGTASAHERALTVLPVTAADTSQAQATASTTTTSSSDVLVNSMTLTPGAGDYIVWFSGTLDGSSSSTYQYVSIYVNGTQVAHSEREVYNESSINGALFPVATHARLTGVGATDAIEVRWRTTGGTATMYERRLTVSKVAAANSFQASATGDTTTTSSSDVLANSMTLTPGAGDYIVWWSGSVENNSTSDHQYVSIYANGTQVAHSERRMYTEGSIPNTSTNMMTHAVVSGLGAGQTIEVKWRTEGGTAVMHERTLVAQKTNVGGAGATSAAAEDAEIVEVPKNSTRRIRFEVSNEGTLGSGGVAYKLQVAETTTCSGGAYVDVPTDTSGDWQITGSTHLTDGDPTTNIDPGLTDESTTFVAGEVKDAGNTTSAITLAIDRFTEIEYAVKATSNATDGATYCFRLYDSTGSKALDTYESYGKVRLEGADVAISIADSPDPVAASGTLVYTLTANNLGPDTANNVVVTNTLSAAVSYVSASGTGWSCSESSGTVTCTRSSIAPEETAPVITITVTAPAAPTVVNNTATISADEPDPVSANDSDSETTTVNVGTNVDLSLAVTDTPDPVVVSSTLIYGATVTNNSTIQGDNVVVSVTLPSGVTFNSAAGVGWTCNQASGVVTCTRATIAGSSAAPVININVTAPASPTTLNGSGTVSADNPDPVGGNNNATMSTTVSSGPTADLTVAISDSPDPVATSGTVTYTVTPENLGPNAATNPVVIDTLPAAATFVSATGTGWACGQVARTVTCTRATLAVGVGPAISVVVTAPASDQVIVNKANISADEPDTNELNNADFENTTVGTPSDVDLGIVVIDGPDPVELSGTITYTLRVINYGPAIPATTTVTDTLPSGVTYVSATGTGWSCSESSLVVTCTASSLSVGWAPEITIKVTAPSTAGTITNSASVTSATRAIDPYAPNNSFSGGTTIQDPTVVEDLCWALSDSGSKLVSMGRSSPHTVTEIGNSGAVSIEAITFGPSATGPLLYAADDEGSTGTLGTLNLTTAAYTSIGEFGTGGGSDGELLFDDVDGLAFHPQSLELWGTFRRSSDSDALFKIDYSTGAHIPDVFGPGVDYLIPDFDGDNGGAVCDEHDMDDIAISEDGRFFVQVDQGGNNQQLGELELDSNGVPTGRFLSCVDIVDVNGDRVDDMEGTGFDHLGVMWGTTGNSGSSSTDDRLWKIDFTTGEATHPTDPTEDAGEPFGIGGDYEGSDCRLLQSNGAGTNTILGTVFLDDNSDGLYHPTETGWQNATVNLYFDQDNDGVIDSTDPLVRSVTTDSNGDFEFGLLSGGPYVLEVEPSTLPASTALTTDNLERSVFVGTGFDDPNNDFGFDTVTMALTSDFRVYNDGGVPVVEWSTASEVGTVAFYLMQWKTDTEEWVHLADDVVPSAGEPQGGHYRMAANHWPEADGSYYAVVEIEASGAERVHGPFFATLEPPGNRQPLEKAMQALAREPHVRRPARGVNRERGDDRGLESLEQNARQGAGRRPTRPLIAPFESFENAIFDIGVRVDHPDGAGLVFVALDELRPHLGRLGRHLESYLAEGRFELTRAGDLVAIHPAADSQGFYFVATPSSSIFSDTTNYQLRIGNGVLMQKVLPATTGLVSVTDFQSTVHFEEDVLGATAAANHALEDFWYWSAVVAGNPVAGSHSYDVLVEQLANVGGTARLDLEVFSASSTGVDREHHIELYLNDAYLGDYAWKGRGRRTFGFDFPSSMLEDGANQIQVTGLLDGEADKSIFYINSFDLTYPRHLAAHEDRLRFRAESSSSLAVGGFTKGDVMLFEVSDPLRARALATNPHLSSGRYRVLFGPEPGGEYLAVASSAVLTPEVFQPREEKDLLRLGGADYIVITPAALRPAAERLARTRDRREMGTLVFDVEDIYGQFSHGDRDPRAIRDFLAAAYHNWHNKPRYAVLIGAGTYDYRDVLGTGLEPMPPLLRAVRRNGLFAGDLAMGDVAGEDDGVPEIAVGRIPVHTMAELDAYREKLEAFESRGERGQVILLADNTDASVGDFPADSETLVRLVEPSTNIERVYLSDLSLSDARGALFEELEATNFWVNYIGHGGVDRFAAEGLLTSADVSLLGAERSGTIFSAMTCVAGRFEVPGYPALGTELVLAPEGGAVAVFSPSGVSINRQGAALDRALFQAVWKGKAVTLGDAVIGAFAGVSGQFSSVNPFETYNILGDPALLLPEDQ